MDHARCLAAIERDAAGLLEAARRGLAAPAPTCPGWRVGHVVAHVGRAYNWVAEIVAMRSQAAVAFRPDDHSFNWREPGVLDWFASSAGRCRGALAAAGPDDAVWSWAGDNRVGFWARLLAVETALHRWDAEHAHGVEAPVDAELARAAIDFTLDVWLPFNRAASLLPSRGESYHLHRTDGEGEWMLRFAPNAVRVTREHAKGDVALRGSAPDLLLFLWRRIGHERLELFGDPALAERYFELVPPR